MLVFWKARLVILAVPKTGTSAYEAALAPHASMAVLDPPELKHAPLYRYNRFFRPMFDKVGGEEMELMAVVREPVSWLGSWFRYRQRGFLDGRPVSTRGMSFDRFVEAYLQDARPPFADVGSQATFVEPRPNGTSVRHLFRYEHQERITGFLEDRLGLRLELPRSNVSPQGDPSLSPAIRARLQEVCAADFEVWNRAL
ncbi:gamma-glutamyl kinase [Salipiger sp.]|uniref:gamma-glutamyl kinase n=1 Tax=Salipiger sp. TaxID=2078585 RepID=UPI003A984221